MQKHYKQQKQLQQQQQQERVRKARQKTAKESQKAASLAIEPVEQPSKLDIGMNIFDIAPQTSKDDEDEPLDIEGDINSLLYPRPERGWRKRAVSTNISEEREEVDRLEASTSTQKVLMSRKETLDSTRNKANALKERIAKAMVK
mmetsp:Transcript_13003/g.23426  ORF Transcript_13003/g.23426 Transcript_13003/m.23426 type:complete len:145 (-) Transcript_13003:803-1237(-)